jgi:signal transduction histidine kinase
MTTKTESPKELRALVELSALINSSLDIQSVLGHAMTCVQEFMSAEASSIFELDADKGELFFRLALGDAADRVKEVRLALGQGIAGWVAETGQPVIIPDTSKDSRFNPDVDDHSGFRTRSILCVPMIYRGQLRGVIQVLNKRNGGEFNEDDQEILTVLANQIATAIENARLYERLSERFSLTSCELKSTQEKLVRAERLAALGRLSQGVAHEVRNPVMVIGGFARRLKKELAPSESALKWLDVILSEAERLEHMVEDIESFCRLPAPAPRQVDVLEILRRVLDGRGLLVRRGVAVEVLAEEGVSPIWADEGLLGVAFRNVFENSLDAMPEGGTIEVSVAARGEGLVVVFRDTGVGIAAEDLPNVFDPFYTSKTRGSGLGLTTVYRIVCDHGGDVAVSSAVGSGTEVMITLPAGTPECAGTSGPAQI